MNKLNNAFQRFIPSYVLDITNIQPFRLEAKSANNRKIFLLFDLANPVLFDSLHHIPVSALCWTNAFE